MLSIEKKLELKKKHKKAKGDSFKGEGDKETFSCLLNKLKKDKEKLKRLQKDKVRLPIWLSKDGENIFRKLSNEFQNVGILAHIDVYNLAILSNSIECTRKLNLLILM